MSKRIQIVSFDVPFPADYGGVIDVFSRIKWFSDHGWEVVLHCFEYRRPKSIELEKYAEVYYYKRPVGLRYWFSRLPYIVRTRINKELEDRLINTEDVVVLEGLHCAHYLNLQPGKFYLRTHNIEHEYYRDLAKNANVKKRLFYISEAKKLKEYEPILKKAKGLLVISEKERDHFKSLNPNTFVVPPYFECSSVYQQTAPFVLFHGNLSVEENDEAAQWIMNEIVPKLSDTKFVIAGKHPSEKVQQLCAQQNVKLVANPSQTAMEELIASARVHLFWTNNSAGMKIKLLKAMCSSGHVICSPEMVFGFPVADGFHLVHSGKEAIDQLRILLPTTMDEQSWRKRQASLKEAFGDKPLKEIFS